MAKYKAPAGSKWITISGGIHNETGEHTGRHVLIDKQGRIVGGAVPKDWQGHSFEDIKSGITKEIGDMYHSYDHDELKDLHKQYKDSHTQMQKELAEDVHGHAAWLRDQEAEGDKQASLIRRIRSIGRIYVPKTSAVRSEWDRIPTGVKKAVGSQDHNDHHIDTMADELGMTEAELLDQLEQASTYQYKKISDYHDKAKEAMGKDYQNRLNDIKLFGTHIKAMDAALARHKHGTVKREKEQAAEKEAHGIWSKFTDQAEKHVPGSKEAHAKGGTQGLLDHIAQNNPKIYEGLKKTMADKVAKGGDAISSGQKKANDMLQKHMPPKKKDNGKPMKPKEEKPQTPPKEEPKSAGTSKKNSLDELHNDAQGYMKGQGDVNDILKKHDKLISRMAKHAAEKRGGNVEAEDLAQHGRIAAAKTLEALKNGTQKPKEGTNLGAHIARRIQQGMSEGARQSSENSLSRGGSKLAAVINSERQKHLQEKGAEPTDDELFNRVKDHPDFKNTKFTKPGTKEALENRAKFDELQRATKGQKSSATLDQDVKGKGGDNAGTVGGNIADSKGSAEDQAIEKENMSEAEQKKSQQREQIMGALKEFGLSDSQAHAVLHRFGVGHGDDASVVKDWKDVAGRMSKQFGKEISADTAKRHYYDGLKKLHKNIGDERMSGLLQKSLINTGDMGAYALVKQLYKMALYDLIKSHDMVETADFNQVIQRTQSAETMSDLLKSLQPNEFAGPCSFWADGSVTATIWTYELRRN